ncbi:hypothetical protein [Exiguobacterium sp. s183]|uniref:hypothetical protein n=1 Tax=Exiguobacterium sp. s183 TaxID=2751262 RepID=UPI001BE9DB16|nr:hypothetical protein [Exiguobacterium sp. s183]
MENELLSRFTLANMIEREIMFIYKQTIFDKAYYQSYDEGQLSAFEQMLEDVTVMYEDEFINKYLTLLDSVTDSFKTSEHQDESIQYKLAGYNDAILTIITYIRPEYPYN